jgi:hypothetical protein
VPNLLPRMASSDVVQTEGFGWVLWFAMYASTVTTKSAAPLKTPPAGAFGGECRQLACPLLYSPPSHLPTFPPRESPQLKHTPFAGFCEAVACKLRRSAVGRLLLN